MARASGANARLILGFEGTYASATALTYFLMPFVSSGIGDEQGLIEDNLLGQGREGGDPILDVVNNSGDIQVPVDTRYIWFWLKGAMGAPVTTAVKAFGSFEFSGQPAANSSITVGGTVWTFVAGAPAANQVQIGANLAATTAAIAVALNASADVQTAKATYTGRATGLDIQFDNVGTAGNAFTLAASATSNAEASGANLIGGGYSHVFTSGAPVLPSTMLEVGFPEVPSYGRNQGACVNSVKISVATSGLLDAVISMICQKEKPFGASITNGPVEFDTNRFAQFGGEIRRNGAVLGNVTSGDFTYSNNLDPVRVIRKDGAILGVDVGKAKSNGTITARFSDTVLLDQAASQLPCALSYGWTTPSGAMLTIAVDRVFLPKPKRPVNGPGGIEVPFAWQSGKSVTTITLINDLAAADYTPA